jgi:hypothetical protein
MPTPAYNCNMRKWSGVYFGPTRGKATGRNKRRGCLCVDSDIYSTECCEGALINQTIGQTQSAFNNQRGAFSSGFSSGFNTGNI